MTEEGGQAVSAPAAPASTPAAPASAPAAPASTPAAPASTPKGESTPPGQAAAVRPNTPPHWINHVPEGTFNERDTGVLKRFNSIKDLAQGYVHAFNLVGRDKIPMPKTEAEWNEVYTRLGRPEGEDGYQIQIREGFNEDFKKEMEGHQSWFRGVAHRLGLNNQQAANLYSEYTEYLHAQRQHAQDTIASEMQSATEELRAEYGPAYEGKMVLANRAVSELGGEKLIKLLEETGMGRHPLIVKAFMKAGEMMGEEVGLDKEGQTLSSMDDLDAQIAEIQADKAYLDSKHPKHKVLVNKMSKLMQLRHPEPKTEPGTIRLF